MQSDIISIIYNHHQNILDIYKGSGSKTERVDDKTSNAVDRWQKIALIIHQNNQDFKHFFAHVKKLDRKNIELEYNTRHDSILESIESEKDPVVKSSLLIVSFHLMVYDLMSQKGNYYFTLDGQTEMYVLKKKLIYYISLSDKNEKNIFFHAFILIFALESLFNKHFYIGVDFEYTNKKIQLAQLNFEHNKSLKSMIQMVSPNELEPIMMENFISLIMCNKYIRKILHGSDSLDIPYIYDHMLNKDPIKIRKFTRTLIDTRFLCEYYKLSRDEASDNKCSIYDAVLYFGAMSPEKHKDLEIMLEARPHVNDIVWNIHKLPESQVLYAQYDVIFLKYFYYQMIYKASLDEKTDAGKKNIITLYKHVLFELTQFVYLERNEYTFVMATCKEQVNPVNNYMVRKRDGSGVFKLIDIFDKVFPGIITYDPYVEIDKVLKVNYFKALVTIIIKKMTYTILSNKYRIMKDKNNVWTDKLDNKFIPLFMQKMNYFYLKKFFIEIEQILDVRIRALGL
jgi:hypothetical protein